MDERFLRIYNRELQHLRETGEEFAREFPKIAGRLGMEGIECADPYVERLLEGFAFLAARIQLKIDAEFPRFTQHILETTYPQYLCPLPSMAIVQFHPNLTEGDLSQGPVVPNGSKLQGVLGAHEQTRCTYTTAHDVALWPLEIQDVCYHTRDLSSLDLGDTRKARAAIRLRLRATAGLTIGSLPIDNLVFYIRGGDGVAMRIYEQLMSHAIAVVAHSKSRPPSWVEFLPSSAISDYGFEDDQTLLPNCPPAFQGYRLLQEYFSLPERFLFFELSGLRDAIARCDDTEIDLTILLKEVDIQLEGALSESNIELCCTPVINLFKKNLDRIHLSDEVYEYHLIPERTAPLDFEVHSILNVTGFGARGEEQEQTFESFYSSHDAKLEESSRFYALHRKPRTLSHQERQGLRRSTRYTGSEAFISLVDADEAPFNSDLRQLGVKALCTNRDLSTQMSIGQTDTDFTLDLGLPVQAIKCLGTPTHPQSSHAEGEHTWRLISHLTPNYLSILDTENGDAGTSLRDILTLYGDIARPEVRRQIEGVRSVQSKPVLRRIHQGGPIAFARGIEITITMDELAFEGSGIFLLGSVFNRFFARYVTMNVFTETVLNSVQRGEIKRWPVIAGRQKNL